MKDIKCPPVSTGSASIDGDCKTCCGDILGADRKLTLEERPRLEVMTFRAGTLRPGVRNKRSPTVSAENPRGHLIPIELVVVVLRDKDCWLMNTSLTLFLHTLTFTLFYS
ncbi:hypothetical protein RRG08_020980 [Elysia crispata]|uniref:Uncharacterized protein n=1 Tax=Elysia crispata TaxID=231223 RepID=A0AAE0ZPC8_9GAST|nr:hypothetical protein RRG08_020980 [Elysia crispata]